MSGVRIPPPRPFMVAVAQLVERRIVTPVAAGSIPVSHPILVLPHSPRKNPLLQRWGGTETAEVTSLTLTPIVDEYFCPNVSQ